MGKSDPETDSSLWEDVVPDNTLIEIVVARYNEDLEWLKVAPFNKYPVIIYNKGPNDNFYKPPPTLLRRIVQLPNVGRESHTFLYHIINNYDSLAPLTAFLSGSNQLEKRWHRSIHLIQMLETTRNTFLSCGYMPNLNEIWYDFKIDTSLSSDEKNLEVNKDPTINVSKIRPFGKWFSATFVDGEENLGIAWNSLIGIANRHIVQKPRSYYERLIKECDSHQNEETGHYFERSWYAVFYPYF